MATVDPWARRQREFPADALALAPQLQQQLLSWHRRHGRHDLPWQTPDPYGVWVSEIMLQQTQVATGLYRYPSWMRRFPTVESLAAASPEDVLKEWEGLGYYARARNLHAAARAIMARHGGQVPRDRPARLALPGVGPSTASAIGAFGFGLPEAIFDANVARVWARWWGEQAPQAPGPARTRFLWGWAQAVMPAARSRVGPWTQAIMDLGATVCTPRNPRCSQCPLRSSCAGRASGHPERWPLPAARPAIKDWHIRWTWQVCDGRVAVCQRPAGGPWQGLWVLPEAGEGVGGPTLASGRHALSHRRIRWEILRSPAPLDPQCRWVDTAQFGALALPKPLRAWWESLDAAQRLALFLPGP